MFDIKLTQARTRHVLTQRECEVLLKVLEGKSNTEIGR